jgi:hypothetical protein
MSDDALWQEMMRVAQSHLENEEEADFAESYRRVARVLAICHRIGVEHPGSNLIERESFEKAELDEFFKKSWRLATLHAEQSRAATIEARRGVDRDAADFARLRALLSEARAMILDFAWLPEPAKRRHLDQLEALHSQIQRARDDFDVTMAEALDPDMVRAIEIARPNPWANAARRVFGVLGPSRVDEPQGRASPRALAPPRNADER